MIHYNRKAWWRISLAFYGTVLPQVLGRVGLLTGFCLLLSLVDDFMKREWGGEVRVPELDQLGHQVLGVAMSMLIVFRTNSSNQRYWEARTLWGALVNASRNLARLASVYAGPADDLGRLIAAYPIALKQSLRGNEDLSEIRPLLPGRLFEQVVASKNPPLTISCDMSRWVQRRRNDNRLDPVTASVLEQQIGFLIDARGGCERIQRTPLPFVYAALIKQLLLLYLASLPLVLVARMGFAAPLVVAVVSLGMLGIEEAGVEIEDPFGLDPNSLPLEDICRTIARDASAVTAVP
ncbi:MAG: hypothetical protein K2Y37_18870 [Pirellulales bacterium]|nr:hypothetical protein [Pirellulales bacterium]